MLFRSEICTRSTSNRTVSSSIPQREAENSGAVDPMCGTCGNFMMDDLDFCALCYLQELAENPIITDPPITFLPSDPTISLSTSNFCLYCCKIAPEGAILCNDCMRPASIQQQPQQQHHQQQKVDTPSTSDAACMTCGYIIPANMDF